MRTMQDNIPEVENFIKSALPKNSTDGAGGVNIGHVTINQNTAGAELSIGGRVKKSHNSVVVIVAALAFAVIITLSILAYSLYSSRTISRELSMAIAEDVRIVAKCENKSTRAIYNELRKKFDYDSYKTMSMSNYYDVKKELESRMCDQIIP